MSKQITYTAWLVYFTAALLLLHTGISFYYMFAPMKWWINYESVSPAKTEFEVGETLKFVSHLALYQEANLEFNDVLFCKNAVGDFDRYSEQNTKRYNSTPYRQQYTTWPYSPGVNRETECYLESNILLRLPLDFDKTVRVRGDVFKIVGHLKPNG